MTYELNRRPSAIRPPCFQPQRRPIKVTTAYPDIALSPAEWITHHVLVNGKKMQYAEREKWKG